MSGTVKDASSAVIPNATIHATDIDTGVRTTVTTNGSGFYSFPQLNIGRYTIAIVKDGFKPYQRTGVSVDANSALTVDAILNVGRASEVITVKENQTQVETTSTQVGEVITGARMTAVPLSLRSFTDLLSLQPGVVPVTSITSDTVQDVGASALSPSGDLNPGTISINGQREFANSFIVNGSDVEEDVNMGAAIVPNLDSIAEFRIITSNFDAEYGEFSGGQINVVTKSGTNDFHGSAFEFLRNTNLDARNYFSPTRGAFDQNQFGGTLGGPIRKTKMFFFGDYQGTRSTQGFDTGQIPVPSTADRTGNLLDLASSFTTTDANGNTVPTTVSGSYWAGLLSQKLGYPVSAGENYYTPGCTSATCVLPNAVIPQSAWSAPATNLLQYIPAPNSANATFATSAFNQTLRDDKGAYRFEASTRWGLMSAYYFLDDWSQNNPYPVAQGGANVPGFNALYTGRAQLFGLGDTKTL
ncbi:MAG: carboxypeptidase-like regulatory domain-containing protein, partial [Terriglobales bacterium]